MAPDTSLAFNRANGNAVEVGDLDAGFDDVRVSLAVTHGQLTVTPLAGPAGTVPTVTGNGTATVELVGRADHIDYILRSLVYAPSSGYTGADALTVLIDDLGHNGFDGAKTASAVVDLLVG